jgi:TPR repeat protein
MNLITLTTRIIILTLLVCLNAFPVILQAQTVEGEVVVAESDQAIIDVSNSSGIREGDTVKFVTVVSGRTLDAGRGKVIAVNGSSIQSSIESGRVNMGMVATIELGRFTHECDMLASLPDDIMAVSPGIQKEVLDSLKGIKACGAATDDHPNEVRFHAQLAYAYLAAEQPGRAILTFEKALSIEPEYPAALHLLATIYRFGPEELQNHSAARERFNKAAELGYLSSLPILGAMCRDGLGGDPDHAEAAKWFEIAANEDDPYSQNAYGECFENGWGVEKDLNMALLWYRSSAEQGFSAAMRNLGRAFNNGIGVNQNPETALSWFSKAANAEDPEAQYELGMIYFRGLITPKNIQEAIKWFQKSADRNFNSALAQLGSMYLEGDEFKKDYTKAASYFSQAAESGHVVSQYNFAVLLEKGSGVKANKNLAIDYYRKAARKDHKASQERLKRLKQTW